MFVSTVRDVARFGKEKGDKSDSRRGRLPNCVWNFHIINFRIKRSMILTNTIIFDKTKLFSQIVNCYKGEKDT